MMDNLMTIGQLAKHTGVTIRTLRYYDKINLLPPTDYTEGGHRLYNHKSLQRLQQIQALTFVGFSLKDTANLLTTTEISSSILDQSITFKKNELIAQQEQILQTIDQLSHMEKIIDSYEHIDVMLFCFIIHSILYEGEHIPIKHNKSDSVFNVRNDIRIQLDKEYFKLLNELKEFVANNVDPTSSKALRWATKVSQLKSKTVNMMHNVGVGLPKIPEKENILRPFTKNEEIFMKKALQHLSSKQK